VDSEGNKEQAAKRTIRETQVTSNYRDNKEEQQNDDWVLGNANKCNSALQKR